jgi:hypothetical protein
MSVKSILENRRTGQSGALLKGSDVPAGTKSISAVIDGVRESPKGFGAPVIVDFKKPLYGKQSWAVNITNFKRLAELFGDDEKKWIGKKIRLEIALRTNPQTGEEGPSLVVSVKEK